MTDLDLLYDYYTSNNLASGAYSALSCRIKDDKLESAFRKLSVHAMDESRSAAEMIIKLGGRIY